MEYQFNTVEEALEELRAGHLILTIDDPDRENEGDLICAAQFATTENVNFMATHAKGLICTPTTTTPRSRSLSTMWTPRPAFPPRNAALPAANVRISTPSRRSSAVRDTFSRLLHAAAVY